jgi:hypothetical protein
VSLILGQNHYNSDCHSRLSKATEILQCSGLEQPFLHPRSQALFLSLLHREGKGKEPGNEDAFLGGLLFMRLRCLPLYRSLSLISGHMSSKRRPEKYLTMQPTEQVLFILYLQEKLRKFKDLCETN